MKRRKNSQSNILIIFSCLFFYSCNNENTDNMIKLLTDSNTTKYWERIDNDRSRGLMFTNKYYNNYYYSASHPNVRIISSIKPNNSWRYKKDSIILFDKEYEFKIVFINKDSLVLKPIKNNITNSLFIYKNNTNKTPPLEFEQFKKDYPISFDTINGQVIEHHW